MTEPTAKPLAEAKTNPAGGPAKDGIRKTRGPSKSLDNGAKGREALIDAACRLLREMPPEKISQVAIARAAGVHPSLVGYYFADLSSLLIMAAERLWKHYHGRLSEALVSAAPTPRENIRSRIAVMLEMGREFPFFHRLMTDVVNQALPGSEHLSRQVVGQGIASYDRLVLEGRAQGEFRPVPGRWLMAAIVGICDAFDSQQPVMTLGIEGVDREQERGKFREFVCDLILNGISAAPAATASPADDIPSASPPLDPMAENAMLRRALAEIVIEKQLLKERFQMLISLKT